MQRIRTDCGQEVFACEVQDRLRDWRREFRPIRPRSPHRNGKSLPPTRLGGERAQQTVFKEFWPIIDLAGTISPTASPHGGPST
ncbi:MAG TPA: hypothetical protein VNS22_13175 [Geminicoccus sp.]|uniref:hypothetical protein n=1 Tax=Geminicoccus sp. TaxID=2024832 RepID=UPI002CEC9E42|nr:hypothetical protein [Geminicoccus sp.]HWL69321.1 hypothetical protein [Geminicoccus sp.]